MLRAPLKFAIMIFLIISSSACDYFKKDRYEKLADNLGSLKDQVLDLADPNKTADEVKKLREIEYKVVDMSEDWMSAEIEAQLNKLGKDYWDCFHMEVVVPHRASLQKSETKDSTDEKKVYRFFCRRQPFTPLRYIIK